MLAVVLEFYVPPKGQRAGTSYERVINDIRNARARNARHLGGDDEQEI
jgi:hypothetical protein